LTTKKSILVIILIITGSISGIFAVVSFIEIQTSIEYFKTLAPGSSTPILDYDLLYGRIGLGIGLIMSGIVVYLKSKN